MPKSLHKYIALCVIGLVSLCFQLRTLNQFPQSIHAWAACDRYALALGFLHNGGDFFHPQTYVMNNQFPGEFMIPRETSVTSVDFPLHDYAASLVMRLSGSTEPWCFRLYTLLYAITGLFFLYRLSALFTPCLWRPLAVVLFALSSPVFLYYQASFLPTIPSLANAIIGLYYFARFLQSPERRWFWLSLLFVTLASLARLPFAIVLVALMCYETYQALRSRRLELFKVLGFFFAIACILAYFLYNKHLRGQYGSLFLSTIIPARSLADFREFTAAAAGRWLFQYFNKLSYLLWILTVGVVAAGLLLRRIRLERPERQFLFLVMILGAGCSLYYVLMCYQYMNHDYYFLDTFYIPFVLLFLLAVVKLPTLPLKKPLGSLFLLLFVPVFISSQRMLAKRQKLAQSGERPTTESYRNAARLLDSLRIPATARLLVLGSDGSNNAFILLKRAGYVIIDPEKEKVEKALSWPYDYIVVDDETMIARVYTAYPEIIHAIARIGGNGSLSVYQKLEEPGTLTASQFFGLDRRKVRFDTIQHFEMPLEGIPLLPDTSGMQGKNQVAVLDSLGGYSYTMKFSNLPALQQRGRLLKVSCRLRAQSYKDLLLCVALGDGGKELLFKAQPLGPGQQGEWQQVSLLVALPALPGSASELGVFIWNRGKNNLLYDDFQVTIY